MDYGYRQSWINGAIRAAEDMKDVLLKRNYSTGARHAQKFADDLKACEKFFLPDRDYDQKRKGGLLSRQTPLEDYADLVSSPYPVWSAIYGVYDADNRVLDGDKRVLLVREDEKYISVEVASFLQSYHRWAFLPGKAFFAKQDPSIFKKIPGGRELYISFDPCMPVSQEQAQGMAEEQITDCFAVIEALIVLGTDNSILHHIKQDIKKQKRREKKGKKPFFDFWVLDVPFSSHQAQRDGPRGTHVSPRFHLRRGHLRRLRSGKVTWVRPTTVGSKDNGIIHKKYQVKPSA